MVKLNDTECEIIMCLANEKWHENKKGLIHSEIIKQKIFSQSESNLPKFLNSLEKKGVIKRRQITKNFDKYRKKYTYQWLNILNDDEKTYEIIYDNLIAYYNKYFNDEKKSKFIELFYYSPYYIRVNTSNFKDKQKEKSYNHILKVYISELKRIPHFIGLIHTIKEDRNYTPNEYSNKIIPEIIEDLNLLKDNQNLENKNLMKIIAKKYKIKTTEET